MRLWGCRPRFHRKNARNCDGVPEAIAHGLRDPLSPYGPGRLRHLASCVTAPDTCWTDRAIGGGVGKRYEADALASMARSPISPKRRLVVFGLVVNRPDPHTKRLQSGHGLKDTRVHRVGTKGVIQRRLKQWMRGKRHLAGLGRVVVHRARHRDVSSRRGRRLRVARAGNLQSHAHRRQFLGEEVQGAVDDWKRLVT